MQTLPKTKIGPFLIISSVLALWTFLVAQHVQAHTTNLPAPSCSNLPTATGFFADANTAGIEPGTLSGTPTPRTGEDIAGRGSSKHYYARITIPQLAAGELRVFDSRSTATDVSDAVLCQGTSTRARYRTTYTNHDRTSVVTTVTGYQTTVTGYQTTANNAPTTTEAEIRSALRTAAGHLGTAASYLRTAASYLRATANSANTVTAAQNAADAALKADRDANTAAAAATAARTAASADPAASIDVTTAGTALGNAATDLEEAATELGNTAGKGHVTFQIRAEVKPGDETYILVAAADAAPTLAVQFNGAIAATGVKRNRSLGAGVPDSIAIRITAPGLLTLETTGSTDTVGTLDAPDDNNADTDEERAYDESGGRSDNFKMVVPVTADTSNDYTLTVVGQTGRTTGAYTLDMDFKVSMVHPNTPATGTALVTGVTATDANWGTTTVVTADDTTQQIRRVAAAGNVADEDYFLFTPASSGFLTVNANDDETALPDANTRGTLFGAMGAGPEMEQRTGQIATDNNSGPGGTHFQFAVPVEGGKNYLVKVEGTDGVYVLEFDLAAVETDPDGETTTQNPPSSITLPIAAIPATLVASTGTQAKDKHRYLFNITESGTLYLETTGPTDVIGFLYGPDGSEVATDDNSGTGTNFRIAANVAPGLYLLEVEGQIPQTAGNYTLVSNFIAGDVDPTTPTTPGTGGDLQAEIDRLEAELAQCRGNVEVDETGFLGNPVNDGFVSGVGLISGWVCAADGVEIRIFNAQGEELDRLDAAYGTSRPDTVGQCDHNSPNTGFGLTYNFNHLAEGVYRIAAYANGQTQISPAHTIEVVHLVDFANDDLEPFDTSDADRFLRNLDGTCRVSNFPTAGETTTLEWQQGIQNFVISDVR